MWLQLIVFVAATIISILLAPKPKQENPAVQKMEDPTADAGMPIPVVRGTMIIKSTNVLWYGEKDHLDREIEGSGGGGK